MAEYQAKSLGQVTATGGAADPDLAAEIAKDTRQLMAYPALETHVDAVSPRGETVAAVVIGRFPSRRFSCQRGAR